MEQAGVLDEFHGQPLSAHGGAVDFYEGAELSSAVAVGDGVVHQCVGDDPFAVADGVGHLGDPVEGAVFVPEPAGVCGEGKVGADDGEGVRGLQ